MRICEVSCLLPLCSAAAGLHTTQENTGNTDVRGPNPQCSGQGKGCSVPPHYHAYVKHMQCIQYSGSICKEQSCSEATAVHGDEEEGKENPETAYTDLSRQAGHVMFEVLLSSARSARQCGDTADCARTTHNRLHMNLPNFNYIE